MATITPTAVTLPASITVPADGENIDAADVNGPLQHIADGVKHVQNRTDVVADLTALAAILVPADGLVRHVLGQGLYVFKTSATTGLSPFRVAATDATVGGWVSSTAHETSRVITVPCSHVAGITTSAGAVAAVAASINMEFGPPGVADMIVSSQGFYPLGVYTGGSAIQRAYLLPLDEFLIHGATLSTATLYLRPISGHGALPTRQVYLSLVRKSVTGYNTTAESLLSFTYVSTGAASVLAYEADLSLVLTADQNNVIDRTAYSYVAHILDESGTNALAGARFAQLKLSFTAIPDARRS